MTDGVAILDNVLAFAYVLDEDFMASGCVLIDCDLFAVYVDDVTLLFRLCS